MSNVDAERALRMLNRHAWLRDCGADLPAAFVAAGRFVRLAAGQWTQAEGDDETGLVFLIEGALQLYARAPGDREVLLGHLEAGSAFGQSARFGGGPRIVTAICVVPSVLLVVSDVVLARLAARMPEVWHAVTALAYVQLRAGARATVDLVALPPRQRLASRLLALAMTKSPRPPVTLHIGQQALGEIAGLTRKTANGVLRRFAREGLVSLGYGRLALLDLKGLQRVAES